MGTYRLKLVVCCLVSFVALLGLSGCGEEPPGGTSATTDAVSTTTSNTGTEGSGKEPEGRGVITVEEALTAEGPVRVMGAIVANYPQTEGAGERDASLEPTVVLTTTLAESYPPQAGEPSMVVVGLDLEKLVGLSSTVGEEGMTPVAWSDYWLVLEGDAVAGALEVTGTPEIMEAMTPELRVRFSSVAPPLVSGDREWWAFDVRNDTEEPLTLVFSSAQQADIVLSQDGREVYRWSDGKMFAQVLESIALQPGEIQSVVLNDDLGIPPGKYDLSASVTAQAEMGGSQVILPALEGTVEVF